jgi:hypothetical protein
MKEGEILFVDKLSLKNPKAVEARVVLNDLSKVKGFDAITKKKKNAFYLALPTKDANIERGFSNFGNMTFGETRNLNVMDLMTTKYLVVVDPKEMIKTLESKI